MNHFLLVSLALAGCLASPLARADDTASANSCASTSTDRDGYVVFHNSCRLDIRVRYFVPRTSRRFDINVRRFGATVTSLRSPSVAFSQCYRDQYEEGDCNL